jgi:hypothetical protein
VATNCARRIFGVCLGVCPGMAELAAGAPYRDGFYLAILIVSGVVLGSWTAQVQRSRLDAALGSLYVRSVDPALHVSRSNP